MTIQLGLLAYIQAPKYKRTHLLPILSFSPPPPFLLPLLPPPPLIPRYRKVAGDVCQGGVSSSLSPYSTTCSHSPTSSKPDLSYQCDLQCDLLAVLIFTLLQDFLFFTHHRFLSSSLISHPSSLIPHPSSLIPLSSSHSPTSHSK